MCPLVLRSQIVNCLDHAKTIQSRNGSPGGETFVSPPRRSQPDFLFARLGLIIQTPGQSVRFMAKLVVVSPALGGLSHELSGGWSTIGRADGNTFQIVEASISGRHCEVRLQGHELVVRDLLSTNGTFVQDRKIAEAVLKPGQVLRLGHVELRLELSATPSPPSPSARTDAPAAALTPFPVQKPVTAAKAETDSDSIKKHHILFVDDSLAFLETFSKLCTVFANNAWEINSPPTPTRPWPSFKKVRSNWPYWTLEYRWWTAFNCSASSTS